jgi:serine/threonine protein kinase
MISASEIESLPPDTVCGYTVLRTVAPSTYITLADGGRQVLLKPLDPDCLLHGQLHPSIKERLARVRELALKSTANLHGVERDERGVFLVWEYVEGHPLDAYAAGLSPSQLVALLREVVLSAEGLHQAGIVHGAIHARNIIIDVSGRPRLTHISPLLYHDPAVDETALRGLLDALLIAGNADASLAGNLGQGATLREMASQLVAVDKASDDADTFDAQDRRRRKVLVLLALATLILGCAIAGILAIWLRQL